MPLLLDGVELGFNFFLMLDAEEGILHLLGEEVLLNAHYGELIERHALLPIRHQLLNSDESHTSVFSKNILHTFL